jgi:CheY-like chemotaxis protein
VTYPGDISGRYDRRIEPLAQSAAALLHFSSERDRTSVIEIRKVRYQVPSTAPVKFQIQPGAGIVSLGSEGQRRADDVSEDLKRHVLVVDLGGGFNEDLLASLRANFDVAVRRGVAAAFSDLASAVAGAILLDVKRDTVNDSLTLVRELRRAGNRAPLILVTQYQLRSDDRARALRAGADEFLSGDMHPDEFMLRVDASVRRGRSSATSATDVEVPIVAQPGTGDGYQPFDSDGFRSALQAHMSRDRIPFFTVLTLQPQKPDDGALHALSDMTLREMRVEGGDLTGIVDDRVAVYLHSARRKDVTPYVERVREAWRRTGRGELRIDTASYPADEPQIRTLLDSASR